jgi:hypothetical protein
LKTRVQIVRKTRTFLSEKIDEKDSEIKRLRSQQSREDFKSLPAYRRLVALRDSNKKEDGRQKLEATDWEEIETEVNSIIPHFAARLTKAYPKMTSSDIEFCIVSLFGFSFNDIPYVLGISFQHLKLSFPSFPVTVSLSASTACGDKGRKQRRAKGQNRS